MTRELIVVLPEGCELALGSCPLRWHRLIDGAVLKLAGWLVRAGLAAPYPWPAIRPHPAGRVQFLHAQIRYLSVVAAYPGGFPYALAAAFSQRCPCKSNNVAVRVTSIQLHQTFDHSPTSITLFFSATRSSFCDHPDICGVSTCQKYTPTTVTWTYPALSRTLCPESLGHLVTWFTCVHQAFANSPSSSATVLSRLDPHCLHDRK